MKIPCEKCGAPILKGTAEKNNGLCMPCKNGYRRHIEKAKLDHARERELDKSCPFRALWRDLVDKVHKQAAGFAGLSEEEKMYFAVGVLDGDTYNGGILQFFDDSSEYYRYAELGLTRLGATHALALLRTAKHHIFGDSGIPSDWNERRRITENIDYGQILDGVDTEYCKDQDDIGRKMEVFAAECGLVKNA